jgi:2-polyprenyl-3-methyl-5-hydroxy-6-metoxy-1,4-benzoquinol methylase
MGGICDTMMYIEKASITATLILLDNVQDKNSKILDIGCAVGVYHTMLHSLGYENVSGLDLSEEYIEAAKEINPYYKYKAGNACQKLPYKPNTFDVVMAVDVLEHVDCPKRLLEGMLNAVKLGGLCILSAPNGLNYEIFSHKPSNKKKPINGSVFQYLGPGVIGGLIRRLGGEVMWVDWKAKIGMGHIHMMFKKNDTI